MLEKSTLIDKERAEDKTIEEPYVRQVEDRSLPAQDVIAEQQAPPLTTADPKPAAQAPVVFVP